MDCTASWQFYVTQGERFALGRALYANPNNVQATLAFDFLSNADAREVAATIAYQIQYYRWRKGPGRQAQRKAMVLLRSLLDDKQRRALAAHSSVYVRGNQGGHYRLWPWSGTVEAVERRRTRYRARKLFCIHDPEDTVPPADSTVAHLLLLRSDEAAFLDTANVARRW